MWTTKAEQDLLAEWNANHDAYATIDRNPNGVNQVIVCKGNVWKKQKLDEELTEEVLNELYERLL